MAFVENQGVKIYWDEQGAGEPILLIMGLSYPSDMWHRTRPALAARYRTIAFDNRGVGRSDVPPGAYSMPAMAADAAAVLDAAGITTAHVLGFSMGGMIAQEFALQYPHRVKSLILGCTGPGGPHAVQAKPAVLQVLMSRGVMNPAEANEAMIPFIYDSATSRQLIDEDMKIRMQWYPTAEGYMGQLQAIFGWEAYSRIAQIAAPTLVIHGETDQLVPTENGKLIAAKIPGAKLVLLPQASHIFSTDQSAASRQAILDFLHAHSGSAQHAQV
jgi:3-oxoadipate enol-lactonase